MSASVAAASLGQTLETIAIPELAELLLARLHKEAFCMSMNTITELSDVLARSYSVVSEARNSLVPINKLPHETFNTIFQLLPDSDHRPDEYNAFNLYYTARFWLPCYVDPAVFVKITQVCRHWRNVAWNMPSLWANITNHVKPSIYRMLQARSRTVPVNVFISGAPKNIMHRLVSADGGRIRSIWWEKCDPELVGQHLLTLPAPELASLTLISREAPEDDMRILPSVLFMRNVPRIRQLTLKGLLWIPEDNLLSLTQLHLVITNIKGLFAEILTLLSRTPNLLDLVLVNLRSVQPDSRVIPLSHLRTLVYKGESRGLALIMQNLSLGPETAVDIQFNKPAEHAAISFSGLSGIPTTRNVTRLAIIGYWDNSGNCKCSVQAVGDASGICIDMLFCNSPDILMHRLHTELPLTQIRELWVIEMSLSGPNSRTVEVFSTMLYSMPSLEKLVVLESGLQLISLFPSIHPRDRLETPSQNGMTLYIIMHRSTFKLETFMSQVRHAREAGFTKLIIGPSTIPNLPPLDQLGLEEFFQSVEYVGYDELPTMDMPSACTNSVDLHWTSWSNLWKGVQAELFNGRRPNNWLR